MLQQKLAAVPAFLDQLTAPDMCVCVCVYKDHQCVRTRPRYTRASTTTGERAYKTVTRTNNGHKQVSVLTLSTGSGNGVWMTLKEEGQEKTFGHHGNNGEARHVE